MSQTKRAIEDIQRLGWELNNESLKRIVKHREDESKKRNTKKAPVLKRGDEHARSV